MPRRRQRGSPNRNLIERLGRAVSVVARLRHHPKLDDCGGADAPPVIGDTLAMASGRAGREGTGGEDDAAASG
jgi:hypothetical protein